MNNLHVHKLLFKRVYATFDNFLPTPVLDSLLVQVKQASWDKYPTEGRLVMNLLSVEHDPRIEHWFSEQVPQLIYEWSGEQVKYINYMIWKDSEGLTYEPHIDMKKGAYEHHVQVYLNDGSDELGTEIYPYWDKWGLTTPTTVPYYKNSGVYLNTVQTIRHGVKQVPFGQERISIRARYVNI